MKVLFSIAFWFALASLKLWGQYAVYRGDDTDNPIGVSSAPGSRWTYYLGSTDSSGIFHPSDSIEVGDSIWGYKSTVTVDRENFYWLTCDDRDRGSTVRLDFGYIPIEDGLLVEEKAVHLVTRGRRHGKERIMANFADDFAPEFRTTYGVYHVSELLLPAFPISQKALDMIFRKFMRAARGYPKVIQQQSSKNLLQSI